MLRSRFVILLPSVRHHGGRVFRRLGSKASNYTWIQEVGRILHVVIKSSHAVVLSHPSIPYSSS